MVRPPSLRKHKTGQYLIEWGGRVHYLGSNPAKAQVRYAHQLAAWAAWVSGVPAAAAAVLEALPPPKRTRRPSVEKDVRAFLAASSQDLTPDGLRFYAKNLKRLTEFVDGRSLGQIDWLEFRSRLREKYGAKTVNHTLGTAKKLLRWAKLPIPAEGFEAVSVPMPPIKAVDAEGVRAFIEGAKSSQLKASLRLAFVLGARPSELVRLLRGEGQWLEGGSVLALNVHKTDRWQRRYLVLGLSAQRLLKSLNGKAWAHGESWGLMVQRGAGRGPGFLRSSAATAALKLGYDRSFVDEWLGHSVSKISLAYMALPDFGRFKELSERLAGLLAPRTPPTVRCRSSPRSSKLAPQPGKLPPATNDDQGARF